MISKLKTLPLLLQNMGWRAFRFRVGYELQKRTGLLKRKFPVQTDESPTVSLRQWQQQGGKFFFFSKESLTQFPLPAKALLTLEAEVHQIKQGNIRFFNAFTLPLGPQYDWITNPDTHYQYSIFQHWTEINDLDPSNGDIKYVWEKSRFTFLYPLIRYDFHTGQDQSAFVFGQITDWIEKNPLNCGPNYVCSQEISLRVLNWTFALYYYRHSLTLTEAAFRQLIQSIYWQIRHVAENIQFSRISVRNNHAITECLALYLTGLLYPFFPESERWKNQGRKWVEEEGLYQIYPDGSYLQFSMNYHRVVAQLFTWAFYLAEVNNDYFSDALYDRVRRTLDFLYQHQDLTSGHLPNYGANDGALFFRLNSCEYRDYRPQLNALYYYFHRKPLYGNGPWQEDLQWYGFMPLEKSDESFIPLPQQSQSYTHGGFYVLRSSNHFAFIRCGNHPDRPMQADNLHLDLWLNGVNLLRDAGSYKYNTTPEELKFFMGTASHNTVQLGEYDQMQKGGRFIWYHWSQAKNTRLTENENWIEFEGTAHVYRHLHPEIYHTRKVRQHQDKPYWEVEDRLTIPDVPALKALPVTQLWHPHPQFFEKGFQMYVTDAQGKKLPQKTKEVYYSPCYGVKELAVQLRFEQAGYYFKTIISNE